MKHKIYITRAKSGLGHVETARFIRKAAETALRTEGVEESCEISVTLTDDAGIHEINRETRNIDRPTDVLSFPDGDIDYDTGRRFLGDMILSLERTQAQAEEYGGGYAHEAQYLTVPSVLHLLGYDHLDDGPEKEKMRAEEKRIMKELGYDF